MGLISIIIPVPQRVNRLVLQTKQLETLASDVSGHDYEFIYVGDGSHQESLRVLDEKAENDKRYRVISLTRDFGPTALILAGITYASGDCAGYFFGRNVDPSKIFGELIRNWESDAKVILGKWADPIPSRRNKLYSDSFIRRKFFPNRIYYRDITSFLIDKDVIYVLSQITDPFSDIIEILAWTGFHAHLVEYSLQLQANESKRLTFEEREISLEYSEGLSLPTLFRMSLMVGLILTTFGVLTTIGLILGSDTFLQSPPDWSMLTRAMIFIVGVQMGIVGLFGERLYRSLEKIRSRPAFIVDSIINPPISPSTEGREKIEKMILSLWSIRKQKIAYASSTSSVSSEDKIEE